MEQAKQAVDSVVEGVKNVSVGKDDTKNNKKGEKKAPKMKKPAAAAAAGTISEIQPPPAFIDERLALFDRLKKQHDEEIAKKPREPIMITMPDGSAKPGTAWETTPRDIAEGISKSLYKRACIAKVRVEGEEPTLWDLERPFEKSCKLEILDFNHPEGKQVFWHSSAHALGEASERCYGCLLSRGPPTEDGFYYDMALPESGSVQASDWAGIESLVGKIAKEKQKFERLEMSKEDLLKMFEQNEFKQHYIQHNVPDGTRSTVYRNGPFIDFCRGPHIPDTGRIEAFAIQRNSATYFLGDAKNSSLQRIVGISFPEKKLMQEHKKMIEEAMKRDHRKIGKDQELFFFHQYSPGSAFWQPHGMRVYNAVVHYLEEEYQRRDYDVVKSPNIYLQGLFETSGHWQHYREDMFHWHQEDDEPLLEDGTPKPKVEFGLKPMNCPGHALLFRERDRSYRELPLRYAEFGVLHRNEASGALSGLTRVRRFEQDDAHIFCTEEQIGAEFSDLFDFLQKFYGMLGLTFRLKLSTRNPEKFMGSIETWDRAESMLKDSLNKFSKECGIEWELNEGDGAFYGPKIDVAVLDCLKRSWQCATLQLDFMQPQNFSLEYQTGESSEQVHSEAEERAKNVGTAEPAKSTAAGKLPQKPLGPGMARPVMIHRAMAGSIERFVAILMEHFAGKWPFWLSPRQVLIVPVGKGFYEYGEEVRRILKNKLIYADIDTSGQILKQKIRRGQLAQYNFIFVVGAQEMENRQVNIRYRDDPSSQDRGTPVALDEAVSKLLVLKGDRGMYSPFQEEEAKPAEKA